MKQMFVYVLFLMLLLTIKDYNSINTKQSESKVDKQISSSHQESSPMKKINPVATSKSVSSSPLMKISESSPFLNQRKVSISNTQVATVIETPEETSVEFTLPEVKVDDRHKLESYYPYFYKTHIIEYQDAINYKELTNDCKDFGCQWCDILSGMNCFECRHGFFLFKDKCYSSCPNGFVADIFKNKCTEVIISSPVTHVVYMKAFSVGSCKNLCGGKSVDCSCHSSCASQGTCCSDYQDCETLSLINTNRKSECATNAAKCELCSFPLSGKVQCAQCSNGYYLRSGSCVESCFPSDKTIAQNKICIKNQDCRVENCSECVDNNPAVCRQCYNGFYMHNNQCHESCPIKYRADRISWACLEAPVFAWYWIFPSVTSCSRRCGQINAQDMDCSCANDCFRYGNCCQDIEDYCPELLFWK